MGYGGNLDFAWQGVWYVEGKITVGAANRAEAFYSLGQSVLCVMAVRSTDVSITDKQSGIPSWLLQAAAKAESAGCGNCGEQAAIAFVHLSRKLKVRPLDYMHRTNADRAFVVIGRDGKSDESDYRTWGSACVVCDPWADAAFAAVNIPKKAYKGETFEAESIFRQG